MRATRTIGRLAATTATTAVILASAGVAAHADSAVVKDKASDVLSSKLVLNDDETDAEQTDSVLDYRRSIASGVDLRSMRVSHGKKTVAVTLRFAELRRDAVAIVAFRLDGQAEPERLFMNTAKHSGTVADAKDKKQCKVPVTTHTGPKGYIRTVIDRSCLDDPTRIKATTVSISIKGTDDSLTINQDVLSPKNLRILRWTKWLKSS
jgi:hypothetical protein